jgi:hypothetical protein
MIGRRWFGESLQRSGMAYPLIVRESCYPFYKPSYTELSNGCSQEVQ